MGIEHLIAFNLALFFAILSPGPALLVALHTALASGRGAGIATTVGLGLTAALWTLAALVGLDAIFALVPWAHGGLKIAGAAYLLYLAWTTWRGAARPLPNRGHDHKTPHRSAVLRGLLVNLTNPKSVLFAGAVLVVIFPPDLRTGEIALIAVNHWLLEIIVYSAIVWIVTVPAARQRYLHLKAWFDRGAASVMAALGLRLILDRA